VPDHVLQGLNPGDVIAVEPLEDRLLRLSDVPGVQVRSTLVPGASLGLSDLIVEVKPGSLVSGSVDADNAGNRYTGENRIGITLNLNNPTGHGDLATLRVLTSGSGLRYGRVAYQTMMGKGRVGMAYSDLAYELGDRFKAPNANGHARIATLFGSYPLIRSRQINLNAGLTLDSKLFHDHLVATDKRIQVATASIAGDRRDTWGGGGVSSYSLAWSTGHLDIRTSDVRSLDATTAQSDGRYNKLSFAASRVQQATQTLSFFASVSGQMASKNLDVSEKMELGGMYGVRAYPEGEAYADEGYLLTLEARQQLPQPLNMAGQLHAVAFIDAGEVKLNHSPWAEGARRRHLSGAGVGLYWTRANSFSVKAFYARKLGSEDATSAPDKSGRFWVQAVKFF
jgi:hemolysin activation/secretion protein